MKTRNIKLVITLLLIIVGSCNEPETVVTNIVHPDGTVTRKIVMRNTGNKFRQSQIQVPLDSTWNIKDSLEINARGDTVRIKRAEKLFMNQKDLAEIYASDSSSDKRASRHISFKKKFRWFNTVYRFAEIIDRQTTHGYPVSEFLDADELQWFYSPDNLKEDKKNGPDSLKYRTLNDQVEKKTEKWGYKNLISEWIYEFAGMVKGRGGDKLTAEALIKREDELMKIFEANFNVADTLWTNGTILKQFLGEEDAIKFKTEADSSVNIAVGKIWLDFNEYTVRTILPGKLTGTNGFIDSSGISTWPVKSDFFLTQQYEMWAESKVHNTWAWITTGIFILFVFSGIIFLKIAKG